MSNDAVVDKRSRQQDG